MATKTLSKYLLLFPVHLFKEISQIQKGGYDRIYLLEDPRYFTDFRFHKLKLAYHRATMKAYYDYLASFRDIKPRLHYVEYKEILRGDFYKKLAKNADLEAYDPADHPLEERLLAASTSTKILPTLNFSITREEAIEKLPEYITVKSGRFNFMNFYKMMRKKRGILVTANGDPIGGKWSFDRENRSKYPQSGGPPLPGIPPKLIPDSSAYVTEAKSYVERNFPKNYGSLDHFIYPIDHAGARKWAEEFCEKRFRYFGEYEDAMLARKDREEEENKKDPLDRSILFHSVLSPMMNVGLITDTEVLEIVEKCYKKRKIPIAGYEGFIRQVIGWRNYVYAVYVTRYGNPESSGTAFKKMVKGLNFMRATKKLPYKAFWTATTGIRPVDDAIQGFIDYGYVHHIQRLMVLGNYMMLMGIRPNDVYTIFMEWAIDAYDWVMMANVYGMSQHADGGRMMTRPYFSSANYILTMSDYKANEEWVPKWNALYGKFIKKHRDYLKRGYATAFMVRLYEKSMSKRKSSV
jgi:deoxyribodipyrimidine photolyase-related protein